MLPLIYYILQRTKRIIFDPKVGDSTLQFFITAESGFLGHIDIDVTCVLSHVQLFATPWTLTHQVPMSMGFSSQEYWSGLPVHPAGDLPDPGMELVSLTSLCFAGGSLTTEPSV